MKKQPKYVTEPMMENARTDDGKPLRASMMILVNANGSVTVMNLGRPTVVWKAKSLEAAAFRLMFGITDDELGPATAPRAMKVTKIDRETRTITYEDA